MPKSDSQQSLLINVPGTKPFPDAYSGSNFSRDLRNFHYMEHDEPHATRRKMILEKHPEIKGLMKPDTYSVFLTFVLVSLQVTIIYLIKDTPGWLFGILTLVLGGTISHALFVLIHDLTHYTAFKSLKLNQLIAIIANFGQGVPSAVSFGRYHGDHHIFLGRPNYDPDLPTQWEIGFFRGTIKKLIFLIILPFFYSLRPYVVSPKPPNFMEIVNLVMVFTWDYFIYQTFGIRGLLYLIPGTLMGLGINPVSLHIMAEHYEFVKGQDTYSYYGPFNFVNLNMGYHIEHHDFPNIPWTRLPEVRKIAPEFYDNLPAHSSYLLVLYKYIFDPNFGAWCRIGRTQGDDIKQKKC